MAVQALAICCIDAVWNQEWRQSCSAASVQTSKQEVFPCTPNFLQVRVKSFASRNQLAVYQTNVNTAVELEWDRRYITVLGVANRRLYEFRLQTANSQYEKAQVWAETFPTCLCVDTASNSCYCPSLKFCIDAHLQFLQQGFIDVGQRGTEGLHQYFWPSVPLPFGLEACALLLIQPQNSASRAIDTCMIVLSENVTPHPTASVCIWLSRFSQAQVS